MISINEAEAQRDTLEQAAKSSPVLQERKELLARFWEWRKACHNFEEAAEEDTPVIVLVGTLGSGMRVWNPSFSDPDSWHDVVRVINRDGQTSIHVQTGSGKAEYLNFLGPRSPIVVRGD